jgi:hypothetical protein
MKQVLLTLGLLLVVLIGYYWVNTRYAPDKKETVRVINDKEIYFVVPEKIMAETETEVKLMARYEKGLLVSYRVDFNYDLTKMKILNIEVNKEIFNKKAQVDIDKSFGKVTLIGENSKNREKLVSGEVVLATLKIKGLSKGEAMIYSSRKSETGIFDGVKVFEGNFQMPNFKVNFL